MSAGMRTTPLPMPSTSSGFCQVDLGCQFVAWLFVYHSYALVLPGPGPCAETDVHNVERPLIDCLCLV
eukprot:10597787-Heterocapsa_arctica.AAC.1